MIKNIEDLKNIQIVCRRNKQDVENCLNTLEKLGFEVRNNDNKYKVIYYSYYNSRFENDIRLECEKDTYFFNKKFIKILKKLINEKKEEEKVKEEEKDFEVAEDGRIIKINNKESEKEIFVIYEQAYNYDYEYYKENGMKIVDMAQNYLDFIVKYGIAYATKGARDKALFKIEIETKLKNIAERLNTGRKIDWKDADKEKFYICYDYINKRLLLDNGYWCKDQGVIYCLDENFLNVAKQEIGEDQLIKYLKE